MGARVGEAPVHTSYMSKRQRGAAAAQHNTGPGEQKRFAQTAESPSRERRGRLMHHHASRAWKLHAARPAAL